MNTNDDRGRRYWDSHARVYDLSLRVLSRPFPRMIEIMREELVGCGSVLEVGAGTGAVTVELAGAVERWLATDYSGSMVDRLRDRLRAANAARVEVQQADLYALEVVRNSFDAVVAANVLHLVPDLQGALQALARCLRPGGKLLAPTFCHAQTRTSRLTSRLVSVTGFPAQRHFTIDSLVDDVSQSGFRVVRQALLPGPIPVGFVAAVQGG